MAPNLKDVYRKSADDELLRNYSPLVHAGTDVAILGRMAHDGFAFVASGKITGVLTATTSDLLLRVPTLTQPVPHLDRIRVAVGRGDVDVLFYEAPTTSADGAAAPIRNLNRVLNRANATLLFTGPTVTGVGTLLHTGWAPPTAAGIGLSANGNDLEGVEEWILQANTDYLIRIDNNSGDTIDWHYEIVWFEPNYPEDATAVVQT